jgi:hypothetical protein
MKNEPITTLREKCQHTAKDFSENPWICSQVRKVSIYLTWLLLRTPLSPNALTVLSFITGIVAVVALIANYLVISVVLILLTIVLDFSDGEVSRYRNQTSREGIYLDKVFIFLVHPVLFAGIVIFEIQRTPSLAMTIAGFICVIGVVCYAVVIDYGKSIVILQECDTWLKSKEETKISDFRVSELDIPEVIIDKNPEILNPRSALFNVMKKSVGLLDFPWIFILMVCVILAELLIPSAWVGILGISPTGLFLFVCSTLYVAVNLVFLFKNVRKKVVDKETEYFLGRIFRFLPSKND